MHVFTVVIDQHVCLSYLVVLHFSNKSKTCDIIQGSSPSLFG